MMSTREIPPGKVKQITSLANPVIKDIRALAVKKYREASGLFLAEGLKLVNDALAGGWRIDTVLYSQRVANELRIQKMALAARAHGADIIEVNDKVLGAISRRDNPQTVIGVVERKWADLKQIRPQDDDLWIVLERVRDPGNLGTIIRTADAAGAKGVILVGETTDPWALEAVRATMGSIFNVALCHISTAEFTEWCSGWPGMIAGTHLSGTIDYREPEYSGKPVLLLMGNEQQGLPEELAALCNPLCLIPMAGKADSLNLAVATAIMVYEVRRKALKLPDQRSKNLS
jgi:RNA methyltransferase, TrmH family